VSAQGEDGTPTQPRPLTQVPPPARVDPGNRRPPPLPAADRTKPRREFAPTEVYLKSQNQAQNQATKRFVPQTYSLGPRDPQILGNYRLMGRVLSPDVATDHSRPVVFLAEGPDQLLVIVKAAPLDSGWEALERLRREARNASRIDGNQVAAIVQGPAEDLDYLYIVQQYVHGTPLDRLLQQKPDGRLTPEDSYRLALGLLGALRAVHAAGVTHRDIKPGNVIVTIDGPVLVDFGNSHHEDDDRITTSGGQRWGTPKYMSPEQFDELGVSAAIDLFGWAVTVVESASGHHPFADPGRQVVYQHVNGRISPNVSGVPVELVPVVRTALEPDPRRRSTAGYLERRLVRTDQTHRMPEGDIPLPAPDKRQLEVPSMSVALADWRTRFEDALVDGNRWFAIACVVAILLAAPAGVLLHILLTLLV
jgi:serine/threonine protein kinase